MNSGKEKSNDGSHFEDKHTLITKGVEDTKNVGQTDENRVREEWEIHLFCFPSSTNPSKETQRLEHCHKLIYQRWNLLPEK